MIFPTRQDWEKWGITEDCHKFFLLRWQEIFHERTLDTWQVRSSNICYLLSEIIEATEIAAAYEPYRHNLSPLIDEAIDITKRDVIVSKYYPSAASLLESIRKHQASQQLRAAGLDVIRERARLLQHYLRDYRERIVQEIYNLLKECPPKYKHQLYFLVMALGVEYLTAGYSADHLRDGLNVLTQNSGTPFEERFRDLVRKYDLKTQTYDCRYIVALPKLRDLPALKGYGISLSREPPSDYKNGEEEEFYEQDRRPSDIVARVTVEALDPYSALPKGLQRLESVFSMIKLFVLQRNVSLRSRSALVTVNDGPSVLLRPHTSFPTYIRDATNPENRLKNLADRLSTLEQSDRDQLVSSSQYHRIAISAPTDEGRIVNLWIALECLTRLKGGAVIEAVCKYIPPSVAVQNPHKIVKGMCVDINRVWPHLNIEELRKVMRRINQRAIKPRELLAILLDDEQGERIAAFLRMFAGHPLLLYRIYRLRHRMFKDASTLRRSVQNHKQNVEWQLRRIYRARNHVIHRGSCKPGASQLIQHLHTYLVVTIHNVIYDLQQAQAWGVSQALENRCLMFERFIEILEQDGTIPVSSDTLLNSSQILHIQKAPYAWQKHVKSTGRDGEGAEPPPASAPVPKKTRNVRRGMHS